MKDRDMFEPSQALFRVDPLHHLFSLVIAFKPSPDWFLGAHQFDLCDKEEWVNYFELPLYPWDAGTKDGVSYEVHKCLVCVGNTLTAAGLT